MSRRTGYVDTEYLAEAARLLERDKHASYEMMRIAPNQTILDVGCGPGTDTVPMAQIVGSGGPRRWCGLRLGHASGGESASRTDGGQRLGQASES